MSTVKVPLNSDMLLKHLLMLDGHLVGAEVHHHGTGGGTVVFHVDYPDAPAGADGLEPAYTRSPCQGQANCPGRVTLTGLRWQRGGVAVAENPAPAGT